jgi:flagella basal body P-ring formation protein FlgA
MNKRKRKSCQTSILNTILYFFMLLSSLLGQVHAETTEEMMQLAQSYILKHLDAQIHNPTISLTPLSATAHTPKCEQPIKIRWNSGQKTGNINLALNCAQPKWQRYINAKISGELPIVMAKKDITSDTDLSLDDVYIGWLADTQVRKNHLSELSDIEMLSTRQFISAGTPLSSNQVRARLLIHKGDQVRILAGNANIMIEMQGKALESGEKNKQIRVQNSTSGKIIKGKIISADSVIVP